MGHIPQHPLFNLPSAGFHVPVDRLLEQIGQHPPFQAYFYFVQAMASYPASATITLCLPFPGQSTFAPLKARITMFLEQVHYPRPRLFLSRSVQCRLQGLYCQEGAQAMGGRCLQF